MIIRRSNPTRQTSATTKGYTIPADSPVKANGTNCMPFKYIHYTGSTTLALLSMTGLRFVGLSNLMYQHRLSPLAGEVLFSLSNLADQADMAFSPFKPSDDVPLAKSYKSYGSIYRGKENARISSESSLSGQLDSLARSDTSHTEIQRLIAGIMHAKQVGLLPSEGPLLPAELLTKHHAEIEKIRKKMILRINAGYIMHMFINSQKYSRLDIDAELEKKIQQVIASGVIPINLVTLKREQQIAVAQKFYDAVFDGKFENLKQDWKLTGVDQHDVSAEQASLTDLFSASIADFNFKFAFLQNILDGKIGLSLSEDQIAMADNPFPMAIILTESVDDSMKVVKFAEYRCKRDLELGTDIRCMAVDPVNAERLRSWLAKYDLLDKVTLVDINTFEPIAPSQKTRLD